MLCIHVLIENNTMNARKYVQRLEINGSSNKFDLFTSSYEMNFYLIIKNIES